MLGKLSKKIRNAGIIIINLLFISLFKLLVKMIFLRSFLS